MILVLTDIENKKDNVIILLNYVSKNIFIQDIIKGKMFYNLSILLLKYLILLYIYIYIYI